MANRGSGVNLALVLAFLLDAEEVFQEPRQAPLVRPFLRMSAGLIIFFASKFDWGMGWMGSLNVMLNFLNFPRLYTFCYAYLNIVDPVTLFGELAVGGVVFFHFVHLSFRFNLHTLHFSLRLLLRFASLRVCVAGQTTVTRVALYMNRLTSVVCFKFKTTRVVPV